MGILREFEAKLRRYSEQVQEEKILDIIGEFEDTAVDLNTNQLLEGKNSKGVALRPYANEGYEKLKRYLNPRAQGRRDLYFEGNFHSGFFMDNGQFPIVFGSTDEKADELTADNGEDIFGVPEKAKGPFIRENAKSPILKWYKEEVFSIR